jgi:hypothetical protein
VSQQPNHLLEDPAWRARMQAPLALGHTERTTTMHVGDQGKSLCGRQLRFFVSSNADSLHEFDSQVTCFSCQRNLITRRQAQRAIRNYDERLVGFDQPGRRSRLSPLAAPLAVPLAV